MALLYYYVEKMYKKNKNVKYNNISEMILNYLKLGGSNHD